MSPILATAFSLILTGILGFPGSSARAETPARALCAAQTLSQNREEGFPEHMLTAISLVESGRWDQDLKARIAWPWTVTSGGEGTFYPTKVAALEAVRVLQAQGVRNIDVGCMQVNLRYHGDAFGGGLDEAMDPAANVAYAVNFLKRLYKETGDWAKAVTAYHSKTPEYAARYAKKINEAWAEAKTSVDDRVELASLVTDVAIPSSNTLFSLARPYEGFYYQYDAKKRQARFDAVAERQAREAIARAKAVDVAYQTRMDKVRAEQAKQAAAAKDFADNWRARKLEAWKAKQGGDEAS
ncbi:MAG: lytic transglycosylase domain-containing protein [Rhodospirillum sp.]|nr:lytic transglycosylase domain-containing protein [Rhodospirillum sp.]MCF8489420.1 lytic transglycosylase domain-containing protein [Rhodospirillum sp.]MCF8501641.1 lytic transglycosylase domain-containing protein [Rhodospirillum sp.]